MNLQIIEYQYKDITLVRHVWTTILKNATDSLLFNQILYWSNPDKKGQTKLRIERDGFFWMAKTYKQWSEELYIPENTIQDGMTRLVALNLVIRASYVFAGRKTTHIRINYDVMYNLLEESFDENFPEEFRNANIIKSTGEKASQQVLPEKPVAKTAAKPKPEITFSEDDFRKFIEVWNTHRGELAEAQTLNVVRKLKIQTYFKEYGIDKTLEMLEKATKVVAKDDWWLGKGNSTKKYNLDNLFNNDKLVSKAESYAEVKEVKSYKQLQAEMLY